MGFQLNVQIDYTQLSSLRPRIPLRWKERNWNGIPHNIIENGRGVSMEWGTQQVYWTEQLNVGEEEEAIVSMKREPIVLTEPHEGLKTDYTRYSARHRRWAVEGKTRKLFES